MKHAIGGFCLGVFFAITATHVLDNCSDWKSITVSFVWIVFWGLLFAGIAWGFFS